MPPEGRTADFFDNIEADGDGIDLEFESIYFRDRAILSIKVYSVIHTLRNELILQKILPLITNSRLDVDTKSSELIGINDALMRELTRLYSDRVNYAEKIQKLEEEASKNSRMVAASPNSRTPHASSMHRSTIATIKQTGG